MTAERTLTILNEEGLHARPAAIFAKTAANFTSNIDLEAGDRRVNAKSIMSIMSLGLTNGTSVKIIARGPDENEAISQLEALVLRRFAGEE